MNDYFGRAEALAAIAEHELAIAKQIEDKFKARQAAAKAWLAVCEAFRGLLFAKGIPAHDFPRNERGRVFMHTAVGNKKLRQLYNQTKAVFHQDAYYDEIIDYQELEEAREAMREYLAETRLLAQRSDPL